MPLDPDHRQGGCINPPWATTPDLRGGLVLKTQIYSPRMRTDADSAAANRLWPSGCLWPKARRLRRPVGLDFSHVGRTTP